MELAAWEVVLSNNILAIDVAFCNEHLMEDAAYESVFQLKLVYHMSEVGLVMIKKAAVMERDTSYYSPGFYKLVLSHRHF